jgi:hypothetical protein
MMQPEYWARKELTHSDTISAPRQQETDDGKSLIVLIKYFRQKKVEFSRLYLKSVNHYENSKGVNLEESLEQ